MPTPGGLIIPGDSDFRIGAEEVNRLHDFDDVDTDKNAHHHTLGVGKFQAASGNHIHDDDNWVPWEKWTNWAPHANISDYGGDWGTGIWGRYTKNLKWMQFTGMVRVNPGITFGQWVFTLPSRWPAPVKNKMIHGMCVRNNAGSPVEDACRIDVRFDRTIHALAAQNDSIPANAWFGVGGLATVNCDIGA